MNVPVTEHGGIGRTDYKQSIKKPMEIGKRIVDSNAQEVSRLNVARMLR